MVGVCRTAQYHRPPGGEVRRECVSGKSSRDTFVKVDNDTFEVGMDVYCVIICIGVWWKQVWIYEYGLFKYDVCRVSQNASMVVHINVYVVHLSDRLWLCVECAQVSKYLILVFAYS